MQKGPLYDYIEKLRNLAEYFARDGQIGTKINTTVYFDDDVALHKNAVSIEEVNNSDILENHHYGELGTIVRMILLINNGDYDIYEKDIIDVISDSVTLENLPERNKQAHKIIMSRFSKLIKEMVLKLCMGLVIPLSRANMRDIEYQIAKQKGEIDEDTPIEDFYYDEPGMESEEDKPYMKYIITEGQFVVMQDGRIIEENIDISLAFEIVAKHIRQKDIERREEEYAQGTSTRKNLQYEGIHIADNDSHDEI